MSAKTIQEINSQYNYKDENPGGKGDNSLVSCAQCEDYNELQYIYNEKLKPFVDKKKFTEQKAITALEKTCKELENPRHRTDFYNKLSEILDVKIE
ncbi:hypothetical protein [Acinetobacter bereziniae]|jgi:hypothetical protein|uniref:hypothetical protein n=1 Tax=Acinetobacter bereziniae TaxID=106648 RepID=UPI00125EF221|nr:hypothetical protein [Acinetobacter bereziniae]MBI0395032.1 hypothetical protein [Acinetobacter bereziniae]MBJ8444008.1 hypothetical protein [Acinetobacter bereziniae]MDM1783698.1 hypothetical protein [Acinetobacter bereziniae]